MIRFTGVVVALWITCMLLAVAAHTFAHQQAPPEVAAVLPDASCGAGCWQGLKAGYVTPEQLSTWVAAPPAGWEIIGRDTNTLDDQVISEWYLAHPNGLDLNLRVVNLHQPEVMRLELEQNDLTLGALMGALGPPDTVELQEYSKTWGSSLLRARLTYPEQQLAVMLVVGQRILPVSAVDALVYSAVPLARAPYALPWRGFGNDDLYLPQEEITP